MQKRRSSKIFLLLFNTMLVFLISVLLGTGIGVLAAPNSVAINLRNTFGAIHRVSTTGNGRVTGTHAFLTAPSQHVGPGLNAQNLTGATKWSVLLFSEVGGIKLCDVSGTCQIHPYMTSAPMNVGQTVTTLGSATLASGGWYEYRLFRDTGTFWTSHFCDGNGCIVLARHNLNTTESMPYATSGAEAYQNSFGPASTAENQWRKNNSTWHDYCWSIILQTVPGSITTCNPSNYSWEIPNF